MLQIKNLSITHKKDLRVILNDFSCVLNDGDKAVIIGEEGNGKSTLLKWIYDEKLVDDYCETEGELIQTKERIAYLPQELPKEKRTLTVCEFFMEEESFGADTKNAGADGGKISCPGRFLLPGAAHGNTVGWRESQGADDETAFDGADSPFAG